MQDKSKEKNLKQNSTIILNVDKISSTLNMKCFDLLKLLLPMNFVISIILSIEIKLEVPKENLFDSLFQMFQIVNFHRASSTNNHNSRNIEKPDLQNYLSNESNLVTGGSFNRKNGTYLK